MSTDGCLHCISDRLLEGRSALLKPANQLSLNESPQPALSFTQRVGWDLTEPCPSHQRPLVSGGEEAGRETVERLVRIFGRDSVYIEVQRHREREEEWRNQAAIRIAGSLKLPVLATNGVRYATAYDREVLDVFTAVRHHTDLDHAGRLLALNNRRHLRPGREMAALFRDVPGAVAETLELSARLRFQLDDLGYEFPRYPASDGETMDSFLRKRVAEGVMRRYGPKNDCALLERAKKQVDHELDLIARLGFAGYFLIVWDIVCFCKKNDILIQGRGSAANSAVCYALEITAIDPVGMELLFERFLSESRGEWPDIDLDLPSEDKREQAIQYVYQRNGELGAAMTANVITYRGKSAAREVGKALGFDQESLGRLSGLVSQWEWRGKTDTMAHSFQNAGFDLKHPRIAKYLELCMRLQDLPRHLGQHSGGMVICQGQLNCVVPLERASMPGRTVVQWDKEDCADLGIIKVDLLGLGMMAVLKDCIELIPRHYGESVDLAQLPEDEDVYKVLQQADTVGMFQVESRAQMASLPRNCPTRFYDLVVQVAIIRPGPIVGKIMHPYMRRRQKKEAVTYPQSTQLPADGTSCASRLSNGASFRMRRMLLSIQNWRLRTGRRMRFAFCPPLLQSSLKQAESACSCWSGWSFASKSAWPTPISSR
jgi:error-prone DNA polymerase